MMIYCKLITKLMLVGLVIGTTGQAQNPKMANGQRFVVAGTRPPDAPPEAGKPLETRTPINPDQKPAFAGQTRAVAVITKMPYKVEVLTEKLSHPWAIGFMPDGRMIITEKGGTIRIVTPKGEVSETLQGVPDVVHGGDAGLLDLEMDPQFAQNRTVYFTYIEPRTGGNGVTVASAQLAKDEQKLENVKVIFRVNNTREGRAHYGVRLLFDKEGKLLVSTSERMDNDIRVEAQWLSSDLGKILRINPDGTPAAGNPKFPDSTNALPEIWAYGVRDPQGMAFNPETGDLWESEHGPQAGDEINIIKPGKNYGWPTIAYGTEYWGDLINNGKSAQAGMEQPVYYWDPAIAPSGMTFYSGTLLPEWKGNLFVTALAGQHLDRLMIKNNKVVGEERLLLDQHQRIRDVAQGPDGALWVVTDANNGRLLRISPK